MKTHRFHGEPGFEVIGGTARSQAAEMNLEPGESTGGPDNVHPESDQWLVVLEGHGHAVVDGEEVPLAPGMVLLVEAGEAHEVRADPDRPLKTLNVYAPPEY